MDFFFWKMAKVMEKSWEFIPWFLGQFKCNSSNLRQIKLPDLTIGTICLIALSLVCYIMIEIDFLRGLDPGKVMGKIWEKSSKSHGIHEQNPCMNPVFLLNT